VKIEDKVITTIYIRRDLKELVLYPKNLPRNLEEESQKLFAELERMRDNIKQAKEELENLEMLKNRIEETVRQNNEYLASLRDMINEAIRQNNEHLDSLKKSIDRDLKILDQSFAKLLEKTLSLNEKVSQLIELKTVEHEEKEIEVEASEDWERLKQGYLTRRQTGVPEEYDLGWISSPKLAPILRKLKLSPEEALQKLREEVSVSDTTQQ